MGKSSHTIDRVISLIQQHIKPRYKELITFKISQGLVKISVDTSILFLILDREQSKIHAIDICYKTCALKGYFTTESLQDLKTKLDSFIGLPLYNE